MIDATLRGTRRNPVQERSQETVQRILDAASHLLTEIPLEQVTTSRIAESAGLSVGGFYRFFPDKQSIIDAIAVRRIEEFAASIEESLPDLSNFDGPMLLSTVLDAYVAFLDTHTDFRTIAFGQLISATTHHRHAQPNAPGARIVKRFMAGSMGMNPDALDVKLRVVIEAGERLIAYAYEQPTQVQRDEVIGELKRMLSSYLFNAG